MGLTDGKIVHLGEEVRYLLNPLIAIEKKVGSYLRVGPWILMRIDGSSVGALKVRPSEESAYTFIWHAGELSAENDGVKLAEPGLYKISYSEKTDGIVTESGPFRLIGNLPEPYASPASAAPTAPAEQGARVTSIEKYAIVLPPAPSIQSKISEEEYFRTLLMEYSQSMNELGSAITAYRNDASEIPSGKLFTEYQNAWNTMVSLDRVVEYFLSKNAEKLPGELFKLRHILKERYTKFADEFNKAQDFWQMRQRQLGTNGGKGN